MEREEKKDCSSYRDCKLFLSEDWIEVVKVNYDIASIPLFRINIPLFSESIQFGTKTFRVKPDNKVELQEVFGLLHLSSG